MLYTKNNQYPTQLPNRIILSSGLSRTNPATFTAEEITDAGYIYVEVPEYNPENEQLSWDGTQFTVESLPPPIPQPDWDTFNQQIFESVTFNTVFETAISIRPLLAVSLPTAMDQVTTRGYDLFNQVYNSVCALGGASNENREEWAVLAQDNNLPQEFIDIVRGNNA